MDGGNIIDVLARVYVDDLDVALPLYEQLSGQTADRFGYHGTRLARVGPFLVIQGATAEARTHVATVNVRGIGVVADQIVAQGGTTLEGPAPGPNGARLVARHPDGNIIEYIQPDRSQADPRGSVPDRPV